METTFLHIFAIFFFFQTYGTSSSHTMITASSNLTCIQKERQSLLVFRQGLTDKSNRLSTWSGVECCEWQGVGCDRRNGHVVKLDLRSPTSFLDYYISSNTSSWLKEAADGGDYHDEGEDEGLDRGGNGLLLLGNDDKRNKVDHREPDEIDEESSEEAVTKKRKATTNLQNLKVKEFELVWSLAAGGYESIM